MRLVIVTIDQRNVDIVEEGRRARRVSSFNFMNNNIMSIEYMANTCTRRPARIHYLNLRLAYSVLKTHASLATKKCTFSCTFKIKNTLKGGIIACTQRAGIFLSSISASIKKKVSQNRTKLQQTTTTTNNKQQTTIFSAKNK